MDSVAQEDKAELVQQLKNKLEFNTLKYKMHR